VFLRGALNKEEALAEINKGRGGQFDPEAANAFIKILQEENS
jgi:HD-GYP domain-containing protein (c-di-GMP phosphodiesterase class II)